MKLRMILDFVIIGMVCAISIVYFGMLISSVMIGSYI